MATDRTADEQGNSIDGAALFVLGQPGWVERTRAAHVPDADQDCRGCGTYRSVHWPCEQIHIADRAEQLVAAARRAGTTTRR